MVGRIISHYRIIERLGEGGMGVVYRAEDLKLGRDVALKFLPPALTRDKEAQERFIREAKAASALDHPNVCNIHEIDETEDGQTFIVMSFYGSETLEQIIKQGPLPIEKALGYAIQVAQGLTKAHAEGVTHRDIKPANIMVTREKVEVSGDSRVKIVDFGLAAIAGAPRLTREGITVGTVSYMSPEQVRGGEIDRRSDIWSLGVVLYELVTGQVPFKGDYQEAVIYAYAILNEAPEPPSGRRTGVPLELDRVVLKALAKRPEERYQHMEEMLVDLTTLRRKLDAPKHGGPQPAPTPAPKRWTAAYASVGLLALATLGILFFRPWSSPEEAVDPPAWIQFTSYPGIETYPTFSPDGSQIAFQWNGENADNTDIYVKQIGVGTYEATRLTDNPNNDLMPSWSPDGNYIAFLREDEKGISIYRKPVLGGIEEKLTEVRIYTLVSWTPDSRSIVFVDQDSVNVQRAVYLYSIETDERQKLTDPPQGQDDQLAFVSPDGEWLAITRGQSVWPSFMIEVPDAAADLFAIPLSGGEPRRLTFDKSRILGLAWSPDSREIVFSSMRKERYDRYRLWRISTRGGNPVLIPSTGGSHTWPAVSPDGLRLACAEQMSTFRGIWEYDLRVEDENGRGPRQIVRSSAHEVSAEYSPDGSKIVFASRRTGNDEIWVCDRDGRNPFRLTYFDGPRTGTPHWSPDGRFIAFESYADPNNPSAFVISATGGRPRRLTPDSLRAAVPFWSPDGRWIYFSNQDDSNIWKISSDGGIPIQVTFNLGSDAGISPDGNWIYYRKPGGSLWRMPATGGDESMILDDSFSIHRWGALVVFDEGIYFRDQATIRFRDLESGNIETVANLEDPGGYMHISPDRKHALMSYACWPGHDIVLFENWR